MSRYSSTVHGGGKRREDMDRDQPRFVFGVRVSVERSVIIIHVFSTPRTGTFLLSPQILFGPDAEPRH
jgi:hypothetical protein